MAGINDERLRMMEDEMNRFEEEIGLPPLDLPPLPPGPDSGTPKLVIGANTYDQVQQKLKKVESSVPGTLEPPPPPFFMPTQVQRSNANALSLPPPPPPPMMGGPMMRPPGMMGPQMGMGGPPGPMNMGGPPGSMNMGGPPMNMSGPPMNMGGSPGPMNMGGPPGPMNMGRPPGPTNMGGPPGPMNYGGPPGQMNYGGPPGPMNYGGPPGPMNMGGPPGPMNFGGPPGPMNYGGPPGPMNMGGPPGPMNMGGPPGPMHMGGHPGMMGQGGPIMEGPEGFEVHQEKPKKKKPSVVLSATPQLYINKEEPKKENTLPAPSGPELPPVEPVASQKSISKKKAKEMAAAVAASVVTQTIVQSTPQSQQTSQGNPPVQNKKKEKKGSKKVRTAGGIAWEDPTLAEWEEDDFRLFCGDLGNDVTDELLIRTFSKYPSFLKAKVVRDKRTNKTKGFGFVSFKDPQDFIRANKEMNGRYVGSRPIKLRKSNWKNRSLEVVRKKEKEKASLIGLLTGA